MISNHALCSGENRLLGVPGSASLLGISAVDIGAAAPFCAVTYALQPGAPVLVLLKWAPRKSIATAAPLSAAYSAIVCARLLVDVFRFDCVLTTVRLPRVASADITISASSSELPRCRSRGGRRRSRGGPSTDIRPDCSGVPPGVRHSNRIWAITWV